MAGLVLCNRLDQRPLAVRRLRTERGAGCHGSSMRERRDSLPAAADIPRLSLADDGRGGRAVCGSSAENKPGAAAGADPVHRDGCLVDRRRGDQPGLLGGPSPRHGALRGRPCGSSEGDKAPDVGSRAAQYPGHACPPARRGQRSTDFRVSGRQQGGGWRGCRIATNGRPSLARRRPHYVGRPAFAAATARSASHLSVSTATLLGRARQS